MSRKKKPVKPKVVHTIFPRAIEWRVELGKRIYEFRRLAKVTPEEKAARLNPDMVTRFNKISAGVPLTLAELSARMNALAHNKRSYSPSTLSRFEQGKRIPSIITLGIYVKVFNTTWQKLIPPTDQY